MNCLLMGLLALLAACNYPLEIDGNGDIISASGNRDCLLEDYQTAKPNCTDNLVFDGPYLETYTAAPRAGWAFVGWENYCENVAGNQCSFNIGQETVELFAGEVMPALRAVFVPSLFDVNFARSISDDGFPRDQIDGITVNNDGSSVITGIFFNTVDPGAGSQSGPGAGGDIFLASYAQNGDLQWQRFFGGPGDDNAFDLTSDAAGNVYVSGQFSGSVDFGGEIAVSHGPSDMFVAKYDSNGNLLWLRRFGGPADDGGNEIAVTGAGEVAATAISNGDFEVDGFAAVPFGGGTRDSHIVRISTDGEVLWLESATGTGRERIRAVDIGDDGTVYAGFEFWGELTLPGFSEFASAGDGKDGALAKISAAGETRWLKRAAQPGAGQYTRYCRRWRRRCVCNRLFQRQWQHFW